MAPLYGSTSGSVIIARFILPLTQNEQKGRNARCRYFGGFLLKCEHACAPARARNQMTKRFCDRCQQMVPERRLHPCAPVAKPSPRRAALVDRAYFVGRSMKSNIIVFPLERSRARMPRHMLQLRDGIFVSAPASSASTASLQEWLERIEDRASRFSRKSIEDAR
jgi:hypothetical protein